MGLFSRTKTIDSSDAGLVLASLGGDRDAFGLIVTRYQSLLCSLAYSAVGDLKHSEDIAQEAFVEAWKKLDTLSDPEKLKAWLCGILRFKISRYRRKEASQPVKHADELDEQDDYVAETSEGENANLENEAIQAQQQALLWQTLEQLPENYREPLVLFYREQHSVERVAEELDLTEDTAKQRLSRGRKLLQQAMVDFVEDSLAKSKPGTAFTLLVMASIANIAPPAKAAVIGTGAAKAGSTFNLGSILIFVASISGLISAFFGMRASLDQSRTQNERREAIKLAALFLSSALIFVVGMYLLRYLAFQSESHLSYFAVASQILVFGFIASYSWLMIYMFATQPKLRALEREKHPTAFLRDIDQPEASELREHKSRFSLLGVPLVHFKLGMAEVGDKPAFAWIAGGDRAYGLLFAWGAFAVAPISVGIFSVGLVSIGAIGLGVLGIGAIGLGFIGFGTSAIAYKAYAALSSLGWESAISGGFSMAWDAAIGPVAFANQINNELAASVANLDALNQSVLWVMSAIAVFVITPAVWYAGKVREKIGRG